MRVRTCCLWAFATSLVALALTACSPFNHSVPETNLLQDANYQLIANIDVPKVDGVSGCGAQALAAVISYLDASQNPQDLAAQLPWHDVGATPVDLLLEARHRGLNASIARGSLDDLQRAIDSGQPPLIMLDSGLEVRMLFTRYPTPKVMHWSVVSGIANDQSRITLASENHRHHMAKRDDFLRRWAKADNCMLIIERN